MQRLVALTAAVAVVALLGGCEGTFSRDIIYDINSLLVCHVQNPLANIAGQPPLIEGIQTISLVPGPRHSVWLPQESGFAPPILPAGSALDLNSLSNFLGNDYNGQFFAYSDLTPFALQARQPAPTAVPSYLVDGQPMLLSISELSGTSSNSTVFVQYLMNITGRQGLSVLPALEGFGIGNCPLNAVWTPLPPTFFPNYFSGGYCSPNALNEFCSIPTGMYCRPDIRPRYLTYVTALRWDCCSTYVNTKWTYSCGWRKVKFPIVSKCFCGCDASTMPEQPFLG